MDKLETRTRINLNGNPIKEKYVECVGCGDWRWIQFLSQAMQCTQCRQSVSLGERSAVTSREFTPHESSLIADFLSKNKPSVEISKPSGKYTERPDYGVSHCSPNPNF